MTDYRFTKVLVWDNLGGSVKPARNQRVTVTDPTTGAVAAGLKVNGQPVPYLTSDSSGHVDFTSTQRTVRITGPSGYWQDETSPDAIEENITAAGDAAASAASAASSATSAQNAANLVGAPAGSAIDTYIGSGASVAVRKGDVVINVTDLGVKGDGTTDDTAAIQAVLNSAAAGTIVNFPPRVYSVSTIVPKAGVKMIGRGATLKARSVAAEGMVATTTSTAVDEWALEGFTLDGNGKARRGVFCRGSRVQIRNNRVINIDPLSSSPCGIRLFWDSTDCMIVGNDVTHPVDSPYGTIPTMPGIQITGAQNGNYAGLDTGNDVVRGTNYPRRNIVTNNHVIGGTHGIMLCATEQNLVQGNYCEMQSHRNIILSPEASYNDISNNMLRQFGSTGVHMAYASDGNHVHGNTIFSDGTFMIAPTGGEGAIQTYVHCQDNRIFGNHIRTKSVRYGIYSAIYCNGTAIEDNDIEWTRLAGIAVSSDWLATPAGGQTYVRPNYAAPPNPAWTSWDNGKGLTQVSIRGNRIRRSQVGVVNAGIYIEQVATAALSNVTIDNNLIDSQNTTGHDLFVYAADATKFTASTIDRNVVQPNEVLHISIGNTIKLTSYANNSWQARQYSVAGGTTVVDWSVSDHRVQNAADTITSFSGLMMDPNFYGRTLTWKMFAGGKVNHGSGITLRGATQATATTNNDIITFKVVNGNAVEVSRNF